jgi:hypothetical protein
LTPFKGNIQKTSDVWRTSSTPAPGTVLYSPSQDGHVFSALATANPDLAREYLLDITEAAQSAGHDVKDLRDKIQQTISVSRASLPLRLRELSREDAIEKTVSAKTIREFLIRRGVDDPKILDCLVGIATSLHALNGQRLTSKLYEVALELKDLKDDLQTSIVKQDKDDLAKVVRRKAIDLIDGLPLMDRSELHPSARV